MCVCVCVCVCVIFFHTQICVRQAVERINKRMRYIMDSRAMILTALKMMSALKPADADSDKARVS